MYKYNDIRILHLEMTTRCNASCPQCSRNLYGGNAIQGLPLVELTKEDIAKIFSPEFIGQLELMYMCGVYGDAMTATHTLDAFEYFRRNGRNIKLILETNGSGRSRDWWEHLAGIVDLCIFGIDGLDDTNHIYRRGTEWQKVMDSAAAFISAGGKADWAFIVFRHNEHQIEEARRLSKSLGFRKFITKKTTRFLNNGKSADRAPVLDRKGRLEYYLEMPSSSEHHNPGLVQIGSSIKNSSDYQRYIANTTIDCKAASRSKIYVSAEGLVFPCCWTAKLYRPDDPDCDSEIWRLIKQLPAGKESINAKSYPLRDILHGPFFQQLIPERWTLKPNHERLKVCATMCGDIRLTNYQ